MAAYIHKKLIEEDILSLIPQKSPFVMIDKLMECTDVKAVSSFHIAAENVMVSSGEFTEGGMMENVAQTAAAGAAYNARNSGNAISGYIVAVKNFEIFGFPKVNDILTTTIIKTGRMFDMSMITGTVACDGTVLAKCEMSIFEGK